jgi:hypothetical protein
MPDHSRAGDQEGEANAAGTEIDSASAARADLCVGVVPNRVSAFASSWRAIFSDIISRHSGTTCGLCLTTCVANLAVRGPKRPLPDLSGCASAIGARKGEALSGGSRNGRRVQNTLKRDHGEQRRVFPGGSAV